MPYVRGESLRHRLKEERQAPRARCDAHSHRGRRRARLRASQGDRAPRHQAREHPARRGPRGARGLRHRARDRRRTRGIRCRRRESHWHGNVRRHADVHVARASRWRKQRRCARGHLRARPRRIRDARGATSLRRIELGAEHGRRASHRACAARREAARGDAARGERGHRACAREAPRRALPHRRGISRCARCRAGCGTTLAHLVAYGRRRRPRCARRHRHHRRATTSARCRSIRISLPSRPSMSSTTT